MINQMIQNSPGMGDILKYLKKNNGDAQKAFYEMAKDKGEDPNSILSQLQ